MAAGAVLVHAGGSVALLSSVFEFNFAANSIDDGYGIVNINGQVQCDRFGFGCQSVCTSCCKEKLCRDAKALSNHTSHADQEVRFRRFRALPGGAVIASLACSGLCLLMIFAQRFNRRGCGNCAALIRAEDSHGIEMYSLVPGDNAPLCGVRGRFYR